VLQLDIVNFVGLCFDNFSHKTSTRPAVAPYL
jgi:hypothetical protein